MGTTAKIKVEFELTEEQGKSLGSVLSREGMPESEVCRLLLLRYLNAYRAAESTGVVPPRLQQEPGHPPAQGHPPSPRPGEVKKPPSTPGPGGKVRLERFQH